MANENTIEKPLDTKQAAEALGVTPRTVIRLVEKGELVGFKVGDLWKFRRKEIENYIERQTRGRQEDQ